VFLARAVARISLPIALTLGLILTTAAPAAAAAAPTEYESIFQLAKSKMNAPWVHYAKGPNKFDCVGYVFYIYKENGLKDRIGGYRGVRGYYKWFRARGMVSRSNPRPGDLIIWGNFAHIGMYIGDGKAISALSNPYGVKIHPVKGYLNVNFRYYLHTRLER
jgi:cell wall-associated NlpC family hydrolase